MRNEALIGYLLHQRPYQEKRALYYLFSQQHGVIHGVGKKGAPLFMPLQLFATGKRDLKTFTQIQITSQTTPQTNNEQKEGAPAILSTVPYSNINGQHQYAALYLMRYCGDCYRPKIQCRYCGNIIRTVYSS